METRTQTFCDKFSVSISVCHYPPGASKWNLIEHRLFSEISKNWRGIPLDSFETIVKYLRTTATKTGLRVTASVDHRDYLTGKKVSDADFGSINVIAFKILPDWNYTIRPHRISM